MMADYVSLSSPSPLLSLSSPSPLFSLSSLLSLMRDPEGNVKKRACTLSGRVCLGQAYYYILNTR
jgi:hypothetical protein